MATKNTTTRKNKSDDAQAATAQLNGAAPQEQQPSSTSAAVKEQATDEQSNAAPNELVSELAYQKYLARGGNHGSDVQDWLDAEREVEAHHTKSRPN